MMWTLLNILLRNYHISFFNMRCSCGVLEKLRVSLNSLLRGSLLSVILLGHGDLLVVLQILLRIVDVKRISSLDDASMPHHYILIRIQILLLTLVHHQTSIRLVLVESLLLLLG